ncbi:MAG: sensor histidine kinase, partial [Vicinamibacteria bacterium]
HSAGAKNILLMASSGWRKRLRSYLFPQEESLDAGFREEVERLSVIGLRVIAVLNFSGVFLLALTVGLGFPEFHQHRDIAIGLLWLLLGGAGLALSFWPPAYPRARTVGLVFGSIVALVSLAAMMSPGYELSVDMVHAHMPIIVSLFLLIQTVTFPLKPIHTFGYGLAMLGAYLVFTATLRTTDELTGMIALHVFLELAVVLLCAGLTAVLYHQRLTSYRARRMAEQSFQQLKAAQVKLLLTQSAASQARLAAAMTHELATPLGAFASAIDTMRLTVEKLLPSDPEGERLRSVTRDALRVAKESGGRLNRALDRMKNVTNLDRAEDRATDINELWRDTAELLESEIAPKAKLRFDLQPVPKTTCRPEQIVAVFSNLLRNAAAATDNNGVILVRTSSSRGAIISEVRDAGRGMSPSTLEHIFEPAFRVEGGRVATSNWGLFVSRSIVVEHGGEITVESELGRGTTVRVVLPAM